MGYSSFDHFFMTLGNKQRVRTLQLLDIEGPQSVLSIAKALNAEQSAISHSLRQLLQCHFVTVKQVGKERIYSINEDTVAPLFKQIRKHVEKYCSEGCEHWESVKEVLYGHKR
ncbi:MAG TPA: helix-turn-helix transcriptional regulator [Verrucomicrobiae bacterium]|nr:helix-turn-helix transcriptional regulator [Verrucomicrobiae bacterium]